MTRSILITFIHNYNQETNSFCISLQQMGLNLNFSYKLTSEVIYQPIHNAVNRGLSEISEQPIS